MKMKEKEKEFDPVLETAMEEISAIVDKYDLMASIAVSSNEHVQYIFKLDAGWSIIKEIEGGVSFNSNSDDYKDKAEQMDHIGRSIIAIESMKELSTFLLERLTLVDQKAKDELHVQVMPLNSEQTKH